MTARLQERLERVTKAAETHVREQSVHVWGQSRRLQHVTDRLEGLLECKARRCEALGCMLTDPDAPLPPVPPPQVRVCVSLPPPPPSISPSLPPSPSLSPSPSLLLPPSPPLCQDKMVAVHRTLTIECKLS